MDKNSRDVHTANRSEVAIHQPGGKKNANVSDPEVQSVMASLMFTYSCKGRNAQVFLR